MKPLIFAIALAGAAYLAPVSAEAARCPRGYAYRPSRGVCSTQRYAKASIRHRAKRAKPVRPAKAPRVMLAKAPATMPTSPMWYVLEPDPFRQPYGRLALPLSNYDPALAAWASLRLWSVEP